MQSNQLAGGLGFEPRLAESEFAVLPLDDPPVFTNQINHLGFTVLVEFYSSCSICSFPGFAGSFALLTVRSPPSQVASDQRSGYSA